jgi:hypothetical protein
VAAQETEANRGGQHQQGRMVRGGLVTGTDPNKTKSDQTEQWQLSR